MELSLRDQHKEITVLLKKNDEDQEKLHKAECGGESAVPQKRKIGESLSWNQLQIANLVRYNRRLSRSPPNYHHLV